MTCVKNSESHSFYCFSNLLPKFRNHKSQYQNFTLLTGKKIMRFLNTLLLLRPQLADKMYEETRITENKSPVRT